MRAGTTNRYPSAGVLFVVCTLLGLLGYTRSHYHDLQAGLLTQFWPDLLDWLACFYPWVLLAPFLFRLEKQFPVGRDQPARNVWMLAVVGIVSAFVATELRIGLLAGLKFLSRDAILKGQRLPAGFLPELSAQLFLYCLVMVNAYVIRNFIQMNERERESDRLAMEKLQLETSLRRAELEALRMRLNPHFLFNTLQNISVLAEHEPETASRMLTRLGDLLRAAFRRDFAAEITLETELDLTRAYLEVERIRFGDRLSVSFDIAPGTELALVPTFLLQPLVENAILHGLRTANTGAICIRSAVKGGYLLLMVSDNGSGLPAQCLKELEKGIGLGSTCQRLELLYPKTHEIEVRRIDAGGTEVRAAIPFHLREALAG